MLRSGAPPADSSVASAYVAASGGTGTGTTLAGTTTITGPVIDSFSSTSASAAIKLTGEFVTGGTTTTNKPHVLIEPSSATSSGAWSTAGTALGINVASSHAGLIVDIQKNGASMAYLAGTVAAPDFGVGGSGAYMCNIRSTGIFAKSAGIFGWSSSGAANGTNDTNMTRLGAGAVGITSNLTIGNAIAIPANGTVGFGYKFTSTANFGIFPGSGAPSISAAQGSLYMRSDGSSTTTRAYFAINSAGALSSWTGVTTAA